MKSQKFTYATVLIAWMGTAPVLINSMSILPPVTVFALNVMAASR